MHTPAQGLETMVIPTPREMELAEASCRVLAQHLPTLAADVQLCVVEEGPI